MMQITRLKFIGENGSMGLKTGRKYNVTVFKFPDYIAVMWLPGTCIYSSQENFLKNWSCI
jgi:hypothetical protein